MMAQTGSINRRKSKKGRKRRQRQLILVFLCLIFFILVILFIRLSHYYAEPKRVVKEPAIDVELLTINPYSRPGTKLDKVKGIVIHYTANPKTSAIQNRNYFEGLKDSHETSASSHFVIGLNGEIVQCIPTSEMAYASNQRNKDTIAIECCIEDDSGKFNAKTYQSLLKLTSYLMGKYHLTTKDVIRHYDVTKKMCPKYYVKHPAAWKKLLADIQKYIEKNGIRQ